MAQAKPLTHAALLKLSRVVKDSFLTEQERLCRLKKAALANETNPISRSVKRELLERHCFHPEYKTIN